MGPADFSNIHLFKLFFKTALFDNNCDDCITNQGQIPQIKMQKKKPGVNYRKLITYCKHLKKVNFCTLDPK